MQRVCAYAHKSFKTRPINTNNHAHKLPVNHDNEYTLVTFTSARFVSVFAIQATGISHRKAAFI